PLRGGYLVNLPKKVQNTYDYYNCEKSPIELAFDFLWDMPEVSVVLSGMRNIKEVKENIGYANNSFINMLNNREKNIINNIREEFKTNKVIPCTFCNYCSNCPNEIAIPYNIAALNEYYSKGDLDSAKSLYEGWVPMFGNQSKECIGCKKCEEICPQKINISEIMSKISEILG
ncbi:MAG: 4Fe-4S dicluster domain-containing protein, partial [Terrisporobacter sp.]|uniref:4Fe-4S dicluster domain-containing protein n=1 Tax=Terrisporobacter sp. TaxID=1965305 RepID=UPI002FCC2361